MLSSDQVSGMTFNWNLRDRTMINLKARGQYLIWKLRSLSKIWYPIEVAEVEIVASEGRRSGQGPGEKKFDQKF